MPSTPPSDATLPLEDLLARAAGARVAVVGDFCLDAYWELDGGEPELSIETGLPTRRVRAQRYSPGGAGNVAVNLAALGVAKVSAIGLAGDDPFGPRLAAELRAAGVDCTRLFRGPPGWQTCVYAKPLRNGAEENRVDFGAFNEPDDGALAQLCAAIEEAASTHDALVVNRQLPAGLVGKRIAGAINRVAAAHPGFFVLVDARDGAGLFRGAALKLNESEAVRMAIAGEAGDEAKAAAEAGDALRLAAAIHRATGRAVFVTRGAKGLVAAAGGRTADVPGVRVPPPIDPVGAGDCIVSALAATLAKGGADDAGQAFQAARFANLAASVILRKLHTTGSASPAEILAAAEAAEYVFEPTLAEDPRLAVRLPGTEIEIVRELPAGTAIRHAVFDHDGTLSTLREGWEKIMEPMMVDAVLGGQAARADDALRARVAQACHELIDHTTGVQTLVQMQALVELVRRFGIVPEADVLDAAGYKRVLQRRPDRPSPRTRPETRPRRTRSRRLPPEERPRLARSPPCQRRAPLPGQRNRPGRRPRRSARPGLRRPLRGPHLRRHGRPPRRGQTPGAGPHLRLLRPLRFQRGRLRRWPRRNPRGPPPRRHRRGRRLRRSAPLRPQSRQTPPPHPRRRRPRRAPDYSQFPRLLSALRL
jgi:rfaE bifunctional protein kinase chain/domain